MGIPDALSIAVRLVTNPPQVFLSGDRAGSRAPTRQGQQPMGRSHLSFPFLVGGHPAPAPIGGHATQVLGGGEGRDRSFAGPPAEDGGSRWGESRGRRGTRAHAPIPGAVPAPPSVRLSAFLPRDK